MAAADNPDEIDNSRYLQQDYERKQVRVRVPQPMGNVMSQLLAKRGYARVLATASQDEAWLSIVGDKIAAATQLGHCKRGILEVTVASSMVLQELTFTKASILTRLITALPDAKIRDIKFRVGKINK